MTKRQRVYLGSTEKDTNKLPEDVKEFFSYALTVALEWGQYEDAKSLKGFNGPGCDGSCNTIKKIAPSEKSISAI